MGSSASTYVNSIEYAEACVDKGVAARERREYRGALKWFEEALRVRAGMMAANSAEAVYHEPYVAVQVQIGEVHLWNGDTDKALFVLLQAYNMLNPMMDQSYIKKTTAVSQFVNVTAGLVLVYTKVHAEGSALLSHLLGYHPLDLAETQLDRAVHVVHRLEGPRSTTLISLFHMLARVLMARKKHVAALRIMQRCLGLTLHVAQTKHIFSFLSYTRNILDVIKRFAQREQAAAMIQQWYRERRQLAFRVGPLEQRQDTAAPAQALSSSSDVTYESSPDDGALPALPTDRHESFHHINLPDILGAASPSEAGTPCSSNGTLRKDSSKAMTAKPREQLPGEVADDGDADGMMRSSPRTAQGQVMYTSLQYVNQNIATSSMQLWSIPSPPGDHPA